MNCSYKTEFHNGNFDEKPIVTMSVQIKNAKKLNALDNDGRQKLINALKKFKDTVEITIQELEKCVTSISTLANGKPDGK